MHILKAAGMLAMAVTLLVVVWDGYRDLGYVIDGEGYCATGWQGEPPNLACERLHALPSFEDGAIASGWFGWGPRLLTQTLGLIPFVSIICALALAARYWLDPSDEEDYY